MSDMLSKIEEGINNQGYAKLLGIKAVKAEEGYAEISVSKRDDLLQQTGTLHGGVIGSLMEAAGGYAALTVLPEGMSLIAVEYKINFLRAITADTAVAKARVIKRGRQLLVIDIEAYNEGSDKLAAKMIMTGVPTSKTKES